MVAISRPAILAAFGQKFEMYPAPRNRALRWIAEIGADLPDTVQQRLRSNFFTSIVPLVVESVNTIAVASVAYLRSNHTVFAAIAFADLLLLLLRVALLRRVNAPSDSIFATGLLWTGLQGATIALVVASADATLSIVVLASGLAAIGGIIGRNFAAPRYAMTQVLIIDLSYKAAFSIMHSDFLPLILIQTVVFVLMNLSIVKQHRRAAIQAIVGELESRRQSFTDPLTGLINRRGLEDAFVTPQASGQDRTLFYLDLDGFKAINDRLGHAAGDMLLREVGRRLCQTAGPDDTVCRLGGDEFLLLTGRLDHQEANRFGTRIIAAITVPYQIEEGVCARVGVSIGIAKEESGIARSLTEMMLRADQALYAAKTSGKGCCIMHDLTDAALGQAA